MADYTCDLLIIGAGPTGLYAAYYAGFRKLSIAVMDSLPALGGQVAALYPEKMIFDVAGFPAVKGQKLIDDLVEQASASNPTYYLGHRAEELTEDADGVTVLTHRGATVPDEVFASIKKNATTTELVSGGNGLKNFETAIPFPMRSS